DVCEGWAKASPAPGPGHMLSKKKIWNWLAPADGFAGQKIFSKSAYHTRYLIIDEHTGTHFDSPSHFVPPPDSGLNLAGPLGEITGEKVPLPQLQGPAAVVDVRHVASKQDGVSPW